MQALHNPTENTTKNSPITADLPIRLLEEKFNSLRQYLDQLTHDKRALTAEEHEAVIVRLTHDLGRAALSEMLSQYDIQTDVISVNDQTYRRKHKASKVYQTALGSVKVDRHVFVNRKKDGDGKSICPLELQAGVIEGYWTPIAAKNAAWALAHLTSQEVEDLLLQFGNMNPSRSSLDRLPKGLFKHWEPQTIEHHKTIMNDEDIPPEATTVAISLDGVMVGMKPEITPEHKGKKASCEWREASCGTISFFDEEGERLSTIQYGRMPEHKKETLKTLLQENIESILKINPDLNVVHLADGAQDNWCFFDENMPLGFQLTDFYHACQYLKSAFNAAYADNPAKACEKFNDYKIILRDEEDGIDRALRALRYLLHIPASLDH